MIQNSLQQLLDDYLTGTITREDSKLLLSYLDDPRLQDDIKTLLLNDLASGKFDAEPNDETRLRLHSRLDHLMNESTVARPVSNVYYFKKNWLKYAAVLVIAFGFGTLLLINNRKLSTATNGNNKPDISSNIIPGGNRATLTLSDGSIIVLDSAGNGKLALQNGQTILKKDGQVIYTTVNEQTGSIIYNTMSTPRGGQYQLTLHDGTKVWLNAASSITFPVAFIQNERKVKISGEVYFDVAADKKKPFIVETDANTAIEVLGTQFNINSYLDEYRTITTLINGSVKVSQTSDKSGSQSYIQNHSVILKPGQQALINNASPINIKLHADIDQALAWKNGLFNFEESDLYTVMRQLERWYDIKVIYEGNITPIIFKGKMYRNINFSDILEILQRMGVKFKMNGKNLIITG